MKKRLISAVVALIILVPLIILGGIPFQVGTFFLSVLGFKEILNVISKNTKVPDILKILSYLSVGLLTLCQDAILPCLALIVIFIFIPLVFIKKEDYNFDIASKLFGSILFTGLIFYSFIYTRLNSIDEFIYLILISILTDTFAYIGGNLFGKHKLIPRVSPNKTIEGSIIGLLFGTIIPAVYYIFMVDPGVSVVYIMLITALLSIVGQLGDLVFSSIKRHYDIKDFSNIMPGHGGIMDRVDSISFIIMTYIIIKSITF